jgi:hypothetical protein
MHELWEAGMRTAGWPPGGSCPSCGSASPWGSNCDSCKQRFDDYTRNATPAAARLLKRTAEFIQDSEENTRSALEQLAKIVEFNEHSQRQLAKLERERSLAKRTEDRIRERTEQMEQEALAPKQAVLLNGNRIPVLP